MKIEFSSQTYTVLVEGQKNFLDPQENNVRKFLKQVIYREKRLGNPTPILDNSLWSYYDEPFSGGIVIPSFPKLKVNVHVLVENLHRTNIEKLAEEIEKADHLSYFKALAVVRKMIMLGDLDKEGSETFVFFCLDIEDDPVFLIKIRRGDSGGLLLLKKPYYNQKSIPPGCKICFN